MPMASGLDFQATSSYNKRYMGKHRRDKSRGMSLLKIMDLGTISTYFGTINNTSTNCYLELTILILGQKS